MTSGGRRGFSVVELLVSTVVLMLVVLIAVQMLSEAGRLLGRSQVELAEPSVKLATQWLRRDIQGASALGRLSFAPTAKPLSKKLKTPAKHSTSASSAPPGNRLSKASRKTAPSSPAAAAPRARACAAQAPPSRV